VITVAAAVVVALIAERGAARWAPLVVLAAPVILGLLALMRWAGPKWCLAALVLSTFLGLSVFSVSVGRVHLRTFDLLYVALVGSLLFVSGRTSARRADVGQRPLAILLFVFGFSLIPLLVVDSSGFFGPFVSWLRLVETFSIVWLMPYVVKRPSDARFVMGTVAGACAIELGRALNDLIASGQLSERLQGGNGQDTEGLLAAVLIVTVIYGMVPRWASARAALVGLGVLSLVLSRNVAAIIAVSLVLALAPPPRRAAHGRSGLLRPLQLVVVFAVAVAVVLGVRSENVPGSSRFANSTTMQRVILGAAGVDIFAHHPILGVGYSRTQLPDVLIDPSVTSQLYRWFPNAPAGLFPAATDCLAQHQLTAAGPTSNCNVQNVADAYIEVAAEEGVIGLLTLLVVAVAIRRRIRRLRAQTTDPAILVTLRWAVLVLVVLLVWWNDNPLYGAQPESLLAALALGTLAVPWYSLRADDPEPSLGEGRTVSVRTR